MTIEEYFRDWSRVVDLKEADRIIRRLSASNFQICPSLQNVFRAFLLCPLSSLRVVIIGQDPYSNYINKRPVATGLAFANSSDTLLSTYSPSLTVLRESVIDFTIPHNSINFDPSLEKWALQGVLLLNSSLSCEIGKSNSHALLWRPFIGKLLTNLSKHSFGIVYVLMGSNAQSFDPYINKDKNYILKCKHPAYYARTQTRMPSNIWREINKILTRLNGYGIEWYTEY